MTEVGGVNTEEVLNSAKWNAPALEDTTLSEVVSADITPVPTEVDAVTEKESFTAAAGSVVVDAAEKIGKATNSAVTTAFDSMFHH